MRHFYRTLLCLLISSPIMCWAWGKRGHQITGEVAALILAEEKKDKDTAYDFFKIHSYDFGFYNNVPDLVWKRPKTYAKERNQHFMDMEEFIRAFEQKKIKDKEKAFQLSRHEFEKEFENLKAEAGRAYWRVQELVKKLDKITLKLKQTSQKNKKAKKLSQKKLKAHQKLQEQWLVVAGVLGHYVADLAQPLHTTENYDGQLTDQKGIHSIYEEDYVNELYPKLMLEVLRQAKKQWPKFKKEHSQKTLVQLLMAETEASQKDLQELLKKDKKMGRQNIKKSAQSFRPLLVKNLTLGSLTLAEIYRRHLGWDYYGEKFYFFGTEPDFIDPK